MKIRTGFVAALAVLVAFEASSRESVASAGTDIDPTGQTDATAALQRLIDSTPDEGIVELEPGARYRIDGTLIVEDRRDLTIDGNGATLFAATRGGEHRAHVRVVGGTRIRLRDFEIVGANPHAGLDDRAYQADMVGQHGIRIEGATDVEIAELFIRDVFGDFVYIGRDGDRRWTTGVWIHDSTFTRNGRQGVTVTAGEDVLIEDNGISHVRRASIDLEPNGPSWGARNVHVRGNTIGPGRLLFVAAAGRGPVNDIVVADNVLRGHILNVIVDPPPPTRRQNVYIVGNTSDTPATRPPIRLTRVDGIVVAGNTQPMIRPGEAFVAATESCGVVVDNALDPGNLAVDPITPSCEPSPQLEIPSPPSIRPAASTPGDPQSSSPSTPPTASTTTEAPVPDPDEEPAAPSDGRPWATAAIIGAVAIVVVGSAWKRARRARLRRASQSTPK